MIPVNDCLRLQIARGQCILFLGAHKVAYRYAQMRRHPGREVALMCLFLFLFSFFFLFLFLFFIFLKICHMWEKKPFDYKKKWAQKAELAEISQVYLEQYSENISGNIPPIRPE